MWSILFISLSLISFVDCLGYGHNFFDNENEREEVIERDNIRNNNPPEPNPDNQANGDRRHGAVMGGINYREPKIPAPRRGIPNTPESGEAGMHFATTKPNIIFILADDLGWSDVNWNDDRKITPNLNQLYRESVVLQVRY